MSAWLRLIPSLLDTLLADARPAVQRHCLRILLVILAVFVATFGLVMLVGGAFLWLAESLSAPTAAAVTGGGLLVVAGLIALAALLIGRGRRRRSMRKSTNGSASGIADLLAAMEAAIGRDARAEAPGFALIALLVGCAVGASPRLRRAIADLAR
jgi:hypothetical protein